MPTLNFENIGDVLDFEFLRGTILTIDSATDTCMVDVAGNLVSAPIFYHCNPDSLLRSNGAIEGAAAGFAIGDSVIVMREYDGSVKVIGHTDGIRRCGSLSWFFYGSDYCFVWDPKANRMKTDVPLNNTIPVQYAVFPCLISTVSDWKDAQTYPDIVGDMFTSSGEGGRAGWVPTVPPFTLNGPDSAYASLPSKPTIMGEPDDFQSWSVSGSIPYTYSHQCITYGSNDNPIAGFTHQYNWNEYFQNISNPITFFQFKKEFSESGVGYETGIQSTKYTYRTPFMFLEKDFTSASSDGGQTGEETFLFNNNARYGFRYKYSKTSMLYLQYIQWVVEHEVIAGGVPTIDLTRELYVFVGSGLCTDSKFIPPLDIVTSNLDLKIACENLINLETGPDINSIPQLINTYINVAIFGGSQD